MKLLRFLLPATFLLLAVSSLPAQTVLPDANDSACWQSVSALHNCVQAQQARAMSQAERCTSYPEYQCQPEADQTARLHTQKIGSVKTSNPTSTQSQFGSKNAAKSQGSAGGGGGATDQSH